MLNTKSFAIPEHYFQINFRLLLFPLLSIIVSLIFFEVSGTSILISPFVEESMPFLVFNVLVLFFMSNSISWRISIYQTFFVYYIFSLVPHIFVKGCLIILFDLTDLVRFTAYRSIGLIPVIVFLCLLKTYTGFKNYVSYIPLFLIFWLLLSKNTPVVMLQVLFSYFVSFFLIKYAIDLLGFQVNPSFKFIQLIPFVYKVSQIGKLNAESII